MCLPDSKSELKVPVIQPQDSHQRRVVFLPQDPDHKCILNFWIRVHSVYSHTINKNSHQGNISEFGVSEIGRGFSSMTLMYPTILSPHSINPKII